VRVTPAAAFVTALPDDVRAAFAEAEPLAATLGKLHAVAAAAYPDVTVDVSTFSAELARRLGAAATPAQLERVRADHAYLAIACAKGDPGAIRRFQAEFLDEVASAGLRLRARPDQIDEVGGHVSRILFVSEPGRPAAVSEFSGRGDLRSYIRVIATRELVRVINKGRREIGVLDDAVLDMMSPIESPELDYLRERYRTGVNDALRAALATLADEPRALLRYSLVDGWSVDRIGAVYGIHRATAARRVAAARELLAAAIRAELAARLSITIAEVDSIVGMVQSRIDVSLERLLG
jgi:RNA polymerase sigma-70 factor (ECF subfamily)